MMAHLIAAALRGALLTGVGAAVFSATRVLPAASRLRAWTTVLMAACLLAVCSVIDTASIRISLPLPDLSRSFSPSSAAFVQTATPTSRAVPLSPGSPDLAPVEHRRRGLDQLVTAVYMVGVATLLLRMTVGTWLSHRMRRRCEHIRTTSLHTVVDDVSRSLGLRHRPPITQCSSVRIPITFGVLRPIVVLPATWSTWSPDTLRSVLAHELGHVRRRDVAVLHLALMYRAVFWFSPVSWWLHRQFERLADQASDETVLQGGADPVRYARTLVRFWALAGVEQHRAQWHLAIARGRSEQDRVRRILEWKGGHAMRMSRLSAASLVLILIPTTVVLALAGPPAEHSDEIREIRALSGFASAPLITDFRNARGRGERTTVAPKRTQALRPESKAADVTGAREVVPIAVTGRIDFTGRWIPVDPSRSDKLFAVGLTDVTGLGMTITQDERFLTIARVESAATAARAAIGTLGAEGTKVYNLDGTPSAGKRDPTEVATAHWENNVLVVRTTGSFGERVSSLSLESAQLRVHTEQTSARGVSNTVEVFFKRES